MGAAENRALIQRFYDEGWNANNLDVYDELVTPDFLEVDGVQVIDRVLDLGQPALEAQEAHTAAFEASRTEGFGTAGDRFVRGYQGPPGHGSEVDGQQPGWGV